MKCKYIVKSSTLHLVYEIFYNQQHTFLLALLYKLIHLHPQIYPDNSNIQIMLDEENRKSN